MNPFIKQLLQQASSRFMPKAVRSAQRTAASLRPSPTSAQFPLDNPLTLLQGKAQYLQRQAQAGINTSQGVFRNLQSVGPTALNPFATSTPTTILGKAGKLVNPLNPLNAGGYLTSGLLSGLPSNDPLKGNLEIASFFPGGTLPKIAATTILGAAPAGPVDELRLIRESNALRQSGQNYKVNGIEYDYKTGRALNPPTNVFIPVHQDDRIDPSYQQVLAERSYKEYLSRAKQLAEQDQLAKKYQVAELTKAYNTASPEEKSKIGLQIWATTNPELAQRLKPGQTGYSEAVTAFQSQSPLGAIAKAAGDVQYADLGNKAFTSPTGPGGVPLGFSPGQLQTPLTGIEIPSTDKIGVSEFFSNTTPAPGAMEVFTDPLSMLSPERLDNAKRALLIQAYNKKLK
jgi:hypothetical protein